MSDGGYRDDGLLTLVGGDEGFRGVMTLGRSVFYIRRWRKEVSGVVKFEWSVEGFSDEVQSR